MAEQALNDLLLGWVTRVPALWCCKSLIREMIEKSKGSASDILPETLGPPTVMASIGTLYRQVT